MENHQCRSDNSDAPNIIKMQQLLQKIVELKSDLTLEAYSLEGEIRDLQRKIDYLEWKVHLVEIERDSYKRLLDCV